MPSVDLWIAFALATITYAAVPGPGTVYIAAQAIMREPGAALRGALGLHVGGYVIVFASAAGLTILFSAVPIIYEGLKLTRVFILRGSASVHRMEALPGPGVELRPACATTSQHRVAAVQIFT